MSENIFVQTVSGHKIQGEVEHWALNEDTQIFEIALTDGTQFYVPVPQVVFIQVKPSEAVKK
ncbi:hypothetical protein ACFFLM_19215 [Deinococcus oregonensis]|uniref:Uncharacterized protein n=1 Tax=Deinococcus oregonensis TaxID=1805970 RepID=A0ABV6B2V5_9DEIO